MLVADSPITGLETQADARSQRRTVVSYYDQCRNDYRILWRTDENGTIHFGFFDDVRERSALTRALDRIRTVPSHLVGVAMALAAGGMALTGTSWGRAASIESLRVAARGRATRHDAAQRRMTDVCAEAIGLSAGERVLDAGCGVGGTALRLAERHRVTVFAINVQQNQLREAAARTSSHPAGRRVRFSVQDFTGMALADGSVDVVWALESVCHCLDKAAFISEASRVLRPGGRLMVADFFLPVEPIPAPHQEAVTEWTSGWALPNLAAVPAFEQTLRRHGFDRVTYRDIRSHVLPSSRRLYEASLVARPVTAVLEWLGGRTAIQSANVRAAYHQYWTLRSGAWTYGIFVAEKGIVRS